MRYFIVAAFSNVPFRGNPAGVCLLESPIEPSRMQAIAAELRQPATAFLLRDGKSWSLRWFSPVVEVALCGHATLAAASVLLTLEGEPRTALNFETPSGRLTAHGSVDGTIWLSLPATEGCLEDAPLGLAECLDVRWLAASRHGDRWILECADAETVRAARPDFAGLVRTGIRSLILTARSDLAGYDIVSRNFAPIVGVDEDQVTGSAHACLAPYWRDRLGPALSCWQASARGGAVWTRLRGNRVSLGGRAVVEFAGTWLPTAGASGPRRFNGI